MADLQSFKQDVQSLVRKFEQDKNHYLQRGYPEAQVRIDFLNPFFDALGWDIENKAQKPPHERDVIVEISPETSLRPDYNFRINGSTKFFVEAKAPWVPLDDVNHIMQAKTCIRRKRKDRLMAEFEKEPLRKYTPCSFKSHDEIATALAIVHVELVLIHPFREGNGRVARMVAVLMALQAGLPLLDFSGIRGKKKTEYFAAVQAGMDRVYGPMAKVFSDVIRRTLRTHEQ